MSLQWQIVAGFLYGEIGLIFLLCLEFISATRWKRIFTSGLISFIRSYASAGFYSLLVVLLLLFGDSINQMWRYRKIHEANLEKGTGGFNIGIRDPTTQMFRAQRNFYISGFSLFLLVVLNRLVRLISRQATLSANHEATVKQATNARAECERLLDENGELRAKLGGSGGDATSDDSAKLRKELESVQKELRATTASLEAMKSQAESTNREYDRLLAEHKKLQGGGDKKSD